MLVNKMLEVGQTVAVERYLSFSSIMTLRTVKHITKGGKVRLDNDVLYDVNGAEIGVKYGHRSYLRTLDEYAIWEAKNNYKFYTRHLASQIEKTKFEHLPLNKLLAVCDLLGISTEDSE